MIIKKADFVKSSTELALLPPAKLPEYAFVGRSNVGKSSLINALVNKKGLAKTSGTPGKTQHINHFLINDSWHLVDLPGYGFAKVGKSQKQVFVQMMIDYVTQRENLRHVFVLIDSRHDAQPIDLEFMEFLQEEEVPFCMVFTKLDKTKPGAFETLQKAYREKLQARLGTTPMMFFTSAERKQGLAEVMELIDTLNNEV